MRKSSTDRLQKLITIRVTSFAPLDSIQQDFLDDRPINYCCRINFVCAANETTSKVAFNSNKDSHNYSFTPKPCDATACPAHFRAESQSRKVTSRVEINLPGRRVTFRLCLDGSHASSHYLTSLCHLSKQPPINLPMPS